MGPRLRAVRKSKPYPYSRRAELGLTPRGPPDTASRSPSGLGEPVAPRASPFSGAAAHSSRNGFASAAGDGAPKLPVRSNARTT